MDYIERFYAIIERQALAWQRSPQGQFFSPNILGLLTGGYRGVTKKIVEVTTAGLALLLGDVGIVDWADSLK